MKRLLFTFLAIIASLLAPQAYCQSVLYVYPLVTQSESFFSRLATQPTTAQKLNYNNLISALVYSGVWQKEDAIYLYAASDQPTALTNLLSSNFTATTAGSPAFAAFAGFTGNSGGTAYVDSNLDPSVAPSLNYTIGNASAWVWRNTAPAGDPGGLLQTASNSHLFLDQNTDGTFYAEINDALFALGSSGYGTATGIFGLTNNGTIEYQNVKGADGIHNSVSSPVLASDHVIFGKGDTYGTTSQISAAGIGGYLNISDFMNLNNAVGNYINAANSTSPLIVPGFTSQVAAGGVQNEVPSGARLCDGRLITIYGLGDGNVSYQTSNVVSIYKTSSDNGKTWSSPTTFQTPATGYTYEPAGIAILSNCTILFSYFYGTNGSTEFSTYTVVGTVAGDGSISWGTPVQVGGSLMATSDQPVLMQNGQVLFGTYDGSWNVYVWLSTDGTGSSWTNQTLIVGPGSTDANDEWSENSFVQLKDESLLGVIRNDNPVTTSRSGYWAVTATNPTGPWSAPFHIFGSPYANLQNARGPNLTVTRSGAIFMQSRFFSTLTDAYTYSTDGGHTWANPISYFKQQGQDVYGQAFYDSMTNTIMSFVGLGGFHVPNGANITFQQFNAP